jgi:hypothetical protein
MIGAPRMTGSAPPPDDDALEALVFDCLEAADPEAELARRTAGDAARFAAAQRLFAQVQRLEQTAPAGDIDGATTTTPDIDPANRTTWPQLPGVTLTALIGRGGQGVVFRGRQEYLDRPVAVKVLTAELRTPGFVARFRREARMLASLRHPHVVSCYDAGVTASGECHLVMEYVDGPTLRAWIDQHGPLPLRAALRVGVAVAEALQTAHGLGLVHRDVKPENVLLQPDPSGDPAFPFMPRLADLGLARPVRAHTGHTMLTPVGAMIGTPQTMAPEQFDAPERVDQRADVYGLGCMLCHAIGGKPAFAGRTVTELILAKAAMRGSGLRVDLPGAPPDVAEFVARMLAADPAERPADHGVVVAGLRALLAPIDAESAPRRRGRRALSVGVAATALGALAFALWPAAAVAPAVTVGAPATAREGHPLALAAACSDPQAGEWRWRQVAGPRVLAALEPTTTALAFTVPHGVAPATVAFVASCMAGGERVSSLVRVALEADPAAGETPAAARQLFARDEAAPMPDWRVADASRWGVAEGGGVAVNATDAATEAWLPLPRGDFAIAGFVEPRFRYESLQRPRAPIDRVLVAVEVGGARRMAFDVAPADADGAQFTARAIWQTRGDDGAWRDDKDLAKTTRAIDAAKPLALAVGWRDGAATCSLDGVDAKVPAQLLEPGTRPGRLTLAAARGVACFSGFVLQ